MKEKARKDGVQSLGEAPVSRLVLRFMSTTLAALLFNSLYNLTDTLFVSWGVGDNAMGGVSIVFPFVVFQGAVATAVGGGAASVVSRRLGQGKRAEAGEATLNAMAVFYGTAIVTTLLGFLFLEPLLIGLGVTEELYPYARQYFIIILAGNVFSTGFSSIIRAEGKMLYGMLIWIIPISINIVLDAAFILVFGWGVRGAALATVSGQFASFCMWVLFAARFSVQQFRGARFRWKQAGEVLSIGLPSLVQMGSLSVITAVVNNVLGTVGGTLGVNTFAYLSRILTFAMMPFTALTQALAPIVGYNYGTGSRERVRRTIRLCVILALGYAAAALILLEAVPGAFVRVFTADTEIIALGTQGLRILALSLAFMPFPMLAGASFQAMGRRVRALVLYAANFLFFLPAALLLGGYFEVSGVWWAYVLANFCAALLAFAWLPAMTRGGSFLS